MKKFAILVAGGSGSRFGSDVPKQFLLLKGKPVLMHTIEKFHQTDANISIRLVLSEKEIYRWNQLCAQFNFSTPHEIIAGGNSRFQSVKNGVNSILLDSASDSDVVAIHDGVRPLIDVGIISKSFEMASQKGNAVVCVPSKDSLRIVNETGNKALERSEIRIIQTPQTFQVNQLKKGFSQTETSLFTDDASVMETAGFEIHLIEGNYKNIKITTPEDLQIAELLYN